MLNNEEVRNEIIEFLGEKNIKLCEESLNKHGILFPTVVEDKIPISMRLFLQIPLNNHINKKFDAVPTHIKDWITFEDYVYNMLKDIIKERNKK